MPKNGTLFSRAIGDGPDLPLDPPAAEAARDEDPVLPGQDLLDPALLEVLGLDPIDIDLEPMGESAVVQGLAQAQVGIVEAGVLSDQSDIDLVLGLPDPVEESFPFLHAPLSPGKPQELEDDAVQVLLGEVHRDLVDRLRVLGGHDGFDRDVGEQADLRLEVRRNGPVRAAEEDVRLDPDGPQLLDAVLGRLGLQLARGPDVGHEGQVDEDRIGRAQESGASAGWPRGTAGSRCLRPCRRSRR